MTCTFFGHRDCPETIQHTLYSALEALIQERGVRQFYLGREGRFDSYAFCALKALRARYPDIVCTRVLAYLPEGKREGAEESVYPEGMENVPPRYAIDRRNRWMLERADMVVCYVQHSFGGAARYVRLATKQGKEVINLCQQGR